MSTVLRHHRRCFDEDVEQGRFYLALYRWFAVANYSQYDVASSVA